MGTTNEVFVPNGGKVWLFSTLPAGGNSLGDILYTSDKGFCQWRGSVWVPYAQSGYSAPGLPGVYLFANLPSAATYPNEYAMTTDSGPVYSNGSTWLIIGAGGAGVTNVATTAPLSGGPITTTGTLSIAANGITNALAAQMPATTIKGNNTGGAANAADLTPAQVNAILPVFTSTLNGAAPLSGGGTTNFLRADGTWAAAGGATVVSTTQVVNTLVGSYTVTATANSAIDVILAGVSPTFTLTFPAGADGQLLRVMTSALISTFAVSAAGTTVNGVPPVLVAGTGICWKYNAAATTWYVAEYPNSPVIYQYTSNATWTNPASGGGKSIKVVLGGSGGGGGSGCSQASGTPSCGGGGGGGGSLAEAVFDSALLPSTVTITVPSGGAGGGSVTTALGNGGATGLDTTFGTYLTAFGGGGGAGGSIGATTGGGAGAAMTIRGGTVTGTAGGTTGTGGGAGGTGVGGGSGIYNTSGGGGAGNTAGTTGSNGGPSVFGGNGGGAGGGLSATVAFAGGLSGSSLPTQQASVAGGAISGGVGTNGRTPVGVHCGTGGGGGGSHFTSLGGNGGVGGQMCGGGGGGSSVTGQPSGNGGSGGNGFAYIVVY